MKINTAVDFTIPKASNRRPVPGGRQFHESILAFPVTKCIFVLDEGEGAGGKVTSSNRDSQHDYLSKISLQFAKT